MSDEGPRDRGQSLPMVSGTSSEGEGKGEAGGPIREIHPSSVRLVSTLAVAGALAGMVIVLVFQWADPRIEAHRARVLRTAIVEVLGDPDHYETAFLVDGAFTIEPPPTADTSALDRIYVGYDAVGTPVGVAITAAEPGFQDLIRLIFGFDPGSGEGSAGTPQRPGPDRGGGLEAGTGIDRGGAPDRSAATGRILGMKVLESKETPGLGDKIEKDSAFVAEFEGVATPLRGVKAARASGADDEIVMITGATISSRAVIEMIDHRLDAIGEAVAAFWSGGAGSGKAGGGP